MTHNIRTIAGLVLVFVVAGLSAIQGLTWTNGIATILPVLLVIEHALNGNTSA